MNTENNKLIAEFMGYKKSIANTWFKGNKIVQTTSFKYDSDWNWLMEVVEKIESKCSNLGFEISARFVHIRVDNEWIISSGVKSNRIEAVYNACIEFIKWNNQQKI